jgi:hypothetical protein
MFAEEQAKQAELRKRAEAEKAKQVAAELAESKKRAMTTQVFSRVN